MTIQEIILSGNYFTDLTTPELAKRLNCSETTIRNYRKGIHHAIKDWFPGIGAKWEDWAREQLINNGINCQSMPCKSSFDILANNGARIEIKVACKPLSAPSSQCISPCWSFKIKRISKPEVADFFMLIIAPEKAVFIIPNNQLPKLDHIRFCYPTKSPRGIYYARYQNAYELIKNFRMEADR